MTDGIGRLSGYGNYGVGGYVPQRRNNVPEEGQKNAQTETRNVEETQVDPSKVMDFLSQNNIYVAPKTTTPVGKVDAATEARVVSSMEQFENIYGMISKEFGEELAPDVMNLVMDKLMGMTE